MHTDPAEQVNAALAHAAQDALPDHKVDTAKPTLESAMVVSTTNTLTLIFSEDLNTTAPAASAFTDRNVDTRPPVPVWVAFDSHLYTVEEGMTDSVPVWLNKDPERTLTIPIWKTYDGGVSFTDFTFPSEVTFTSGEIFKKLTFTTTQDQQDENGERVGFEIREAAPAETPGFPRRSTVYIVDDDAGVSVSTNAISVARGESETYTLVLATLPTGDVTVTPSSREEQVTFSPPTITFAPNDWNRPKTVTGASARSTVSPSTPASGSGPVAGLANTPTATPTRTPTPSPTPAPTAMPESTATTAPTPQLTVTPAPAPTASATPGPTATPLPTVAVTPTPAPAATTTGEAPPPDDGAGVTLWIWPLLALLAVGVAAGGYVYYVRTRRGR